LIIIQFQEVVIEMSKKNSEAYNLDRIRGPFIRHLKQAASSANGMGHFLGYVETHVDINGFLCAGFEDKKSMVTEEVIAYPIDEV
jgi:hypothetical protein